MRTRPTILFTAIILTLFAFRTSAGGVITVDPNTPGARSAVEDNSTLSADPRLAQKVTYEAQHKSLKVILDDLSQLTGVTFLAGYNSKDWQVRDRKMSIFVSDVALVDLMNSMSRVMKFEWSINQDLKPWTYRLCMDRSTLAAAEAERRQAEERYSQEIRGRRQKLVDSIMGSDSLSADDWEKLRDENPYMYELHQCGTDKLMQTLFKEIPGLLDSFVNVKRNIVPPTADLSPEARKMLFSVIDKTRTMYGNGEPLPGDLQTKIMEGKGQLNFEIIPRDFTGWQRDQHVDFGGMGAYISHKWYQVVHFGDMGSKTMQLRAKADLSVLEDGVSPDDAGQKMDSQYGTAMAEDAKGIEDYLPLEPVIKHEDEPWMHEKIKMDVKKDRFADTLAALAKASGLPIVSDSFALTPGSANIDGSERELGGIISALEQGYRYNWEKHGDIIEFRNREWFRKRGVQVPDEWIDKWRSGFRKTGYLSVDDYAQMAALSSEQIEENLMTDKVFGKVDMYGWDLINYRDVLRLYASLDSNQRKMIYSPAKLNVDVLSPDQNQTLLKFFDLNNYRQNSSTDGLVRLRATVFNEANDEHRFEIAALGTDDAWIQNWNFLLPKYDTKYEEATDDEAGNTSESTE